MNVYRCHCLNKSFILLYYYYYYYYKLTLGLSNNPDNLSICKILLETLYFEI